MRISTKSPLQRAAPKKELIENYVGQSLAANGITLRYWKNNNTQEVEYILLDGMNVIPVAVKKGKNVDAIR